MPSIEELFEMPEVFWKVRDAYDRLISGKGIVNSYSGTNVRDFVEKASRKMTVLEFGKPLLPVSVGKTLLENKDLSGATKAANGFNELFKIMGDQKKKAFVELWQRYYESNQERPDIDQRLADAFIASYRTINNRHTITHNSNGIFPDMDAQSTSQPSVFNAKHVFPLLEAFGPEVTLLTGHALEKISSHAFPDGWERKGGKAVLPTVMSGEEMIQEALKLEQVIWKHVKAYRSVESYDKDLRDYYTWTEEYSVYRDYYPQADFIEATYNKKAEKSGE